MDNTPRTLEQFGQLVKTKYPDYADMGDADVATRVLTKYPQYNDMVTTTQKNESMRASKAFQTFTSLPSDASSAFHVDPVASLAKGLARNAGPEAPGLSSPEQLLRRQKQDAAQARQRFNTWRQAGSEEANTLATKNPQSNIGSNGQLLMTTPLDLSVPSTAAEISSPLSRVTTEAQARELFDQIQQHQAMSRQEIDAEGGFQAHAQKGRELRRQYRETKANLPVSPAADVANLYGTSSVLPLVERLNAIGGEIGRNGDHPDLSKAWEAVSNKYPFNPAMPAEYQETNPQGLEAPDSKLTKAYKGVQRTRWKTEQALTTPESLLTIGAAALGDEIPVVSELGSLYFSGQAARAAVPALYHGTKKLVRGDVGGAAEDLSSGLLNTTFAGLGGLHLAGKLRDASLKTPADGTTWRNKAVPSPVPPPAESPIPRMTANPEQTHFNFSGNMLPDFHGQSSFDFSQLPEQKPTPTAPPQMDPSGQMRLFPNMPKQMDLPLEYGNQTPAPVAPTEEANGQGILQFPHNPWQMPLDFDQKAPQAPPPAEPASPLDAYVDPVEGKNHIPLHQFMNVDETSKGLLGKLLSKVQEKFGKPLGDLEDSLPLQQIPAKDLVSFQRSVQKPGIQANLDTPNPQPSLIVKQGGKYYVVDGNHRIVAQMLRNEPVTGLVADLDANPQELNPSQPTATTVPAAPRVKGSVALAQTLEKNVLRPIVSVVTKLARLKQAGADRMHVERAVRASGKNLFSADDLESFKKAGWTPPTNTMGLSVSPDHPFLDSSAPYSELDPKEKTTVDTVAKHLQVDPESLRSEDGDWRLSKDQYEQLGNMLEAGKRPGAKGAIEPLAHINPENASAAGLKNSRSLRALMSKEDLQKLEQEEAGRTDRYDPDANYVPVGGDAGSAAGKATAGAEAQRQAEGLTTIGQSNFGYYGINTEDPAIIEAKLEGHQNTLQEAIDSRVAALREHIPTWERARSGTKKPSALAKEIAGLPPEIRGVLPEELHAEKHSGTKVGGAAESTNVQEPVQGASTTPARTGTETPNVPTIPKGASSKSVDTRSYDEVLDSVNSTIEDIREKHAGGEEGALSVLWRAVTDKYRNREIQARVMERVVQKYEKHLDAGTENPLQSTLAETVNKFKPESGVQSTLHANPIQPIWDRLFATYRTPDVETPLPVFQLAEPGLGGLTDLLKDRNKPGVAAQTRAYFSNEATRLQSALASTPKIVKNTIDSFAEATKAAVHLYLNRPGLSPVEAVLGVRSLELMNQTAFDRAFAKQALELHPDKARREAMVNYIQAGGLVRPETEVVADLQHKADAFNQTRLDLQRTRQGYVDAQKLTSEEKEFVATYRHWLKTNELKEQAQGLQFNVLENYIKQMWDKDSMAAKSMSGLAGSGAWSVSPNFAKLRKFESYFAGEQAGFKAKNKDVAFLIGARARASAEVLANRAMIENLRNTVDPKTGDPIVRQMGTGLTLTENPGVEDKAGAVIVKPNMPKDAVTSDGRPYESVPHPSFDNWKWVGTVKKEGGTDVPVLYKGSMLVHPDHAQLLRDVLGRSFFDESRPNDSGVVQTARSLGKGLLNVNNAVKQTILVGLFHPIQLGVHFSEHVLGNLDRPGSMIQKTVDPVTGAVSYGSRSLHTLNPMADSIIDLQNNSKQQGLVVHGLQLDSSGARALWSEGVGSTGFVNSAPLLGPLMSRLHDGMFGHYIPNMKMGMAMDMLDRNMSRYYDQYQKKALSEIAGPNPTPADHTSASITAQSKIYRMTAGQANAAFGGLNWDAILPNKTAQDFLRLGLLAPDFFLARIGFAADAFRPGGAESRRALFMGFAAQYLVARAANAALNDGDAKWDPRDWNKIVAGDRQYSLRTVQGDMMDAYFDTNRFIAHRINPIWRPLQEAVVQKDVWGNPLSSARWAWDTATEITPIPLEGLKNAVGGKLFPDMRLPQNSGTWRDSVLQSVGVQAGKYYSPATREIRAAYNELPKSKAQDELSLMQKSTFLHAVDLQRQGKLDDDTIQAMMDSPKANLKAHEIPYIYKQATEPWVVSQARQLTVSEVDHAWSKPTATVKEKIALAPILMRKAEDYSPNKGQETLDKVQNFLGKFTDNQLQEIYDQIAEDVKKRNEDR